jgi:hypothetical protein
VIPFLKLNPEACRRMYERGPWVPPRDRFNPRSLYGKWYVPDAGLFFEDWGNAPLASAPLAPIYCSTCGCTHETMYVNNHNQHACLRCFDSWESLDTTAGWKLISPHGEYGL